MSPATPERTYTLKYCASKICAGGGAGSLEVLIMHPLDVLKTRFQVQRGAGTPGHYGSIWNCIETMRKTEGGVLSFYKGILPPLSAEFGKRAIKFFSFDLYLHGIQYMGAPHSLAYVAAGMGSGLTEAVFINPFEVVKVKLQTDRGLVSQQKSTLQTGREIWGQHGFGSQGLRKGLTSTLLRHGVFNMIYFGFFHNVKQMIPQCERTDLEYFRRFLIGFVGSTLACFVNIPFDVAKSRIQGPQPVPNQIKYKTCWGTLKMVYTEEGFRALYKGLALKIMRLGPGGAIMLIANDVFFEFLHGKLQ